MQPVPSAPGGSIRSDNQLKAPSTGSLNSIKIPHLSITIIYFNFYILNTDRNYCDENLLELRSRVLSS